MTDIIYHVAASLDGFIATVDDGVAWLPQIDAAGEDFGYHAFYDSIDALLMGSRTYAQVMRHAEWPYPGKPCWVFTHRRLADPPPEVIATAQAPSLVVAELRGRGLKRGWLVGGGQLASSFRSVGLISEYVIGVVPTILGMGIPLLAGGGPVEQLKLAACERFARGEVLLHYRRG